MRLLKLGKDGSLELTKDLHDNIPAYAILSHTWGNDDDELKFEEFGTVKGESKMRTGKMQFCITQAKRDGYEHFWVDTCCINKTSSQELQRAIRSMYDWYRNAEKCYVYLSDVSTKNQLSPDAWEPMFSASRWFTRGWTLQELLAPRCVEFFSAEGELLGSKKSLEHQIHGITKIPLRALQGAPPSEFGVNEILAWANGRKTKEKEDKAYSLIGIFGVSMCLGYGEGEVGAFRRLKKSIREASISDDEFSLTSRKPKPSNPKSRDFLTHSELTDHQLPKENSSISSMNA
jgi:hypothetical protein